MEPYKSNNAADRAFVAACSLYQTLPILPPMATKRTRDGDTSLPQRPSLESCKDRLEYYQRTDSERGTYLYLGYGSNLCNETFRGKRGIKPLSQVNVQVPSLRLTFDLPGIPYTEPCFANSGRRDPESDRPIEDDAGNESDEKSPFLSKRTGRDEYRKDRWHKGLIGVVYEVTPEDYAHIIQTEGGGSSYQDILVDCHPFATSDPTATVPQNPTLPPFRAHTLFAPARDPTEPPSDGGGRFQRPDPSYAQASPRYLKLMTDGASELGLPYEYQDYLHSLRPYTMTSVKQRMGQFVLLTLWGPFVALIFALGKAFADDKGRLPPWLVVLSGAIFKSVWTSYDNVFKGIFGDGERTVSNNGKDKIASMAGDEALGTMTEFGARLALSAEDKV